MSLQTKTVFISNIPTQVSPLKVRDIFSEIGPLQRWYLTRDQGGCDLKGSAVVTYTCAENATKAVQALNKSNLEGKIILVKYASKKYRHTENNHSEIFKNSVPVDKSPHEKSLFKSKRGRLVIRNLSYKANEANLKEHFLPCGPIKDICILRYPNGKMKGVGFVEYSNILSANKAVQELNMKPFLGRPIAVDFAVPKHEYEVHKGIKKEPPDSSENDLDGSSPIKIDLTTVKVENDLQDNTTNFYDGNIAGQDKNMSDFVEEIRNIKNNDDDIDDDNDGSENESEDSEGANSESENENDSEMSGTAKKESFNHNPVSKDVMEGKTIFIRNISFNASVEKIEEILSEFGELKYVMFCKDKATQRFTGSGFAQFNCKEGCDSCLEAFDDPAQKALFKVDGRTLTVSKAVGRNSVDKGDKMTKGKEKKDTRNLYLAREGVIREGTKAAFGVSKTDLLLRTQREIVKRKMLMNYNIYISTTRLCVHNLPLTLDDKELLSVFKTNSPGDSGITECRIMRNLYDLDDEGKPKGKGFGFIAFTNHEHALSALRNINNNPLIFTPKQRPVVEFSMENKAALKAKENRRKKSLNNIKLKTDEGLEGSSDVKSTAETPFMGAVYDPNKTGLSSLATHVGPKIRHRDRDSKTKISRNQINNNIRNRRRGKKRPAKGKQPPGKKAKKLKKIRS